MSATQPRPDFFIVGAPKCGTTALFNYLRNRSDIYVPAIKEPQFFAEDIYGHQRNVNTLDEYLGLFTNAHNHRRIGEGSTAHLASPSAAQRIKAFNSDAKIIVMLRNPIDVMHAEHNQRVISDMEQVVDFAKALESRETRIWRSGPFQGQVVNRPSYREITQFSTQVRRYFEAFNRERVHIIIHDDFKASSADVYASTLRFLGLDPHSRTTFPVVNENRRVRSMVLWRHMRYPPSSVRKLVRLLLPEDSRRAIFEHLQNLNVVPTPRPPMDPYLRRRLQREYEPEVQMLSALLDRDLSPWCLPT